MSPSSSGSVRPSGSGCLPRAASRTRSRLPAPTPSPRSAQAYPELAANTETGEIVGVAGRVMFARNSGKLCFATLQEGDGTQLQVMISLDQRRTGVARRVEGRRRSRRHRFRARRGDQFPARRTVCACRFLANCFQGAAAASRRPQGDERGVAGPAALRRPDRSSGGPHHCPPAGGGGARGALGAGTARLSRSGDADAADAGRRCRRPPVRHALQCARRRPLPSHRTGTVPEALLGRWFRARSSS